ncbi:MAG: YCF48-related protein [Blastocatellia bacterium]
MLSPVAPAYTYGGIDFLDLVWIDDQTLWAIGYNGADPRLMWYSQDAGSSWQVREAPTGGFTLSSISFADSLHGWAACNSRYVIRTSDGGQKWERLKVPVWMSWTQIQFASQTTGFLAGSTGRCDRLTDNCTTGIKILRSTDGGTSWRVCFKDSRHASVFQITTQSEKVALVVVDGNALLKTTDGGNSWKEIRTPAGGISTAGFKGDGTLWAVGHHNSFFYSTNLGESWHRPESLPAGSPARFWWDIAFADDKSGVATGDHGLIAVTRDGGRNWSDPSVSVDDHLRRIRLHGRQGFVIGARQLYRVTLNACCEN